MKKLTYIFLALATLISLAVFTACNKEEVVSSKSKIESSSKENWELVTNKTFYNGVEYEIIFKSDRNSNKIEFVQNFPEDILNEIKSYDESGELVQEVTYDNNNNMLVYVYKNKEEYFRNSMNFKDFSETISYRDENPIRQKSFNGAAAHHWEHGGPSGWKLSNYTSQWINWVFRPASYGFRVSNVGSQYNDRISVIEFEHIDKQDRFLYEAYEHIAFNGRFINLVSQKYSNVTNYKFELWRIPLSYFFFFQTSSWNDQITSYQGASTAH